MICSNCGIEVPEGTDYCEACGAPLNEPVVISKDMANAKPVKKLGNMPTSDIVISQTDGKFININGYISSFSVETYRLVALVAGIAMYLSPFLFWYWKSTGPEKVKQNLFSIARKYGDMAQGSIRLNIMGILMLLCGVGMILYSARNYIRPVVKYSNKKMLWIGVEIVSIVAFLLAVTDGKFEELIQATKSELEFVKALNKGGNFGCGYGAGFYLAIIAMILFMLSLFMGILNTSEVDRQASL